jgi:hypothetical protein
MNKLNPIIASLVLTFFTFGAIAQTDNKDVNITSSGSGATLEDAKQAALRSATEQAFGAFISSKTEMFNDQVVADQMASVSSGNIKSYEVLNESQLPDGRWGVTIKALISVDKLTSFVQAKGVEIEIKGGMFALNIKQQMLNEQGEIKAVAEMVGLLHEPMQMSFDYSIKSGEPKSIDAESKNWEIPLEVTAICNKNIDFCANYFNRTLAALSLSSAEVETYKSLNKQVFPIKVNYKNQTVTFNLRKQTSILAIKALTTNWGLYNSLFSVHSGMDESYGWTYEQSVHDQIKFIQYDQRRHQWSEETFTIFFPTSRSVAGTFRSNDKRTLNQIEQMTGYTVKPRGVVSQFKNGGYLVYENDGHGLIMSLINLGLMSKDVEKPNIVCEELMLNGYNDWRLPSMIELELICGSNLALKYILCKSDDCWNSEKEDWNIEIENCYDIWSIDSEAFDIEAFDIRNCQYKNYVFNATVRAVRAF